MVPSPFDRPYSPGEVELDSTSLGQSQAVSPRTLVEPALRVTIPKVTWPSAMSRHSSVKMRSPQTLEDRGAQDLLRLALEAHSSREAADDQAVQETSGEHTLLSRAPSEEWDGEEQLNSLRESMPIFVDSGETAGLPSTRDSAQKNSKDAWQLVRTYTMGVRTRKNASRKAQRVVADQEKEEDQENSRKAENKDSYFVRMVRDRNESMGADPTAMGFNTSPNANRSGGGILSSLMALQQQNQSASGTTTPGGSIISSRASSVTSHSSDSEDEEGERAKFTYQQREKRRRGAWSNVASNVASGVTKSLGLAGAKPVSATLEIPRSARRPLPQTPLSPPLATPERPRSLFSTSRPSSPTPSEGGSFTAPLSSRPVSVSGMSSASKLNKHGFSLHLKDLPLPSLYKLRSGQSSKANTPTDVDHNSNGDYFMGVKESTEAREEREWEKEKRRRKKVKEKRKSDQIFIVAHVAAILSRQDFIMKLGRAFMMFGAPSHRLEGQIQATARVLEINCQVIYLPGVMLISFGDDATHTSELKFLKQANGLDLGKLLASYFIYWNVIHDRISVTDASLELDSLMIAPPQYKLWQQLIIGGLASAFIQPTAFYGSAIDCLVAIPLGSLLVLVQVVVSKNDLYSSLFEIVIASCNSFLAAALASTNQFCYSAVASGSVVLILPGYIVLSGSLELANRSIISGSVRLVYSILYSLFLGFGLSIGAEVYHRITGMDIVGSTDYTCSALRVDAPWYRATISPWFFFLSAPGYLLLLGLRNGQPLRRKESLIMVIVGSAGWVCNYFSSKAFVGRPDISSAIGSFVVGILGNLYGKFTNGSAFVVMVVGVLFQLPSGLANGGLLQFASASNSNSTGFSYGAGFSVASNLVQVAIGLTFGLFFSASLLNFIGGGRRRGSNLSSF